MRTVRGIKRISVAGVCSLVRKRICDSAPNSYVLDPIPTTLLKKCLDDLVSLICRIVNDSLLSGFVPGSDPGSVPGSVPRQFKEAVVIPLLNIKSRP